MMMSPKIYIKILLRFKEKSFSYRLLRLLFFDFISLPSIDIFFHFYCLYNFSGGNVAKTVELHWI